MTVSDMRSVCVHRDIPSLSVKEGQVEASFLSSLPPSPAPPPPFRQPLTPRFSLFKKKNAPENERCARRNTRRLTCAAEEGPSRRELDGSHGPAVVAADRLPLVVAGRDLGRHDCDESLSPAAFSPAFVFLSFSQFSPGLAQRFVFPRVSCAASSYDPSGSWLQQSPGRSPGGPWGFGNMIPTWCISLFCDREYRPPELEARAGSQTTCTNAWFALHSQDNPLISKAKSTMETSGGEIKVCDEKSATFCGKVSRALLPILNSKLCLLSPREWVSCRVAPPPSVCATMHFVPHPLAFIVRALVVARRFLGLTFFTQSVSYVHIYGGPYHPLIYPGADNRAGYRKPTGFGIPNLFVARVWCLQSELVHSFPLRT